MELIDNINRLLGDDLKKTLKPQARLKIAASCFSIYAFEALKSELEKIEELSFIFTSPTFVANEVTDKVQKERREFHIPKSDRERSLYGSEFEIQLRNKLTQRAIAKECADWMRRKATFKSNRSKAPMQQFACVQAKETATAYMPLHGFTAVDLGYQQGNAVSNLVNKMDEAAFTSTYISLFDQIWVDPEKLEDVTAQICDHIASVYQENSPEHVYFLMLYNIFNEFLEDINEDVLPNDRTGYQDTLIWNKLFNYQKDAATGIINKLETYSGCILADSVGLGKTFTALAVVKYYELRNKSVLVLCPKKLADNWLNYNRNLKTNIFSRDRFNYDVLCHTDLSRTSGESFGTPLSRINWGNYDLVVIDESHNFRNNDAFKDKETRYQKLMNQVIKQGVKTKVLMLSATGDVSEPALRRIQIREAIKAHFEKEQALFSQGIKVLSLFFIDTVSKYRSYDESGEQPGEYAQMFEEEYNHQLAEVQTLDDTPYNRYIKGIATTKTHNGYFSIDKKTKRMVDPETGKKSTETDDVDAYDLILKDKERLLSFDEPVRFIFSHSALREGWDNPNVFVICTLKHSDNTVSRRQEVGRGLRLSVNQHGDRMDNPATVHQVNVLTVVASESYKDFVTALQRDISEGLSERPRVADESYFTAKVLKTTAGDVEVTPQLAKQIYKYLLKNDYTDSKDKIAEAYHEAKKEGTLAALPPELELHADAVFALIDSVFSDAKLPLPEDDRKAKTNPLNANFEKSEFKALWSRINRKAAYTVEFETPELVAKCVKALEAELKVSPMQYTVIAGEQLESATYDGIRQGESFKVTESTTDYSAASAHSAVKYDLIGRLAGETQLTRTTVASVLQGINKAVFSQYRTNPEDFMQKAARLMNEQKATVIVEHIAYDPTGDTHTMDIFTQEKPKEDFSKAVKANHHIYDYVFTDSKNERDFVRELDASTEVVVYAKLPRGFFIPICPFWA
ncbi:SNF2-related protein [Limnohabitans sp. MMS-10A-192]|uniref:SNF2-related protein n=1 Tax=Limnohabitans sp. MMS-10A-192 TaxID=1835769 RepID=UPI001E33C9A4|nr:SNF2-related protein [Limnohabitans sp. MMS-10A-192]